MGDWVVGVDGNALGHPTDKLAEAASLIRGGGRPIRLLFQPAKKSPAKNPLSSASNADAGPTRKYSLTYPAKSLGISLLDEGAGVAPVVESAAPGKSTPQGALAMPLPGHSLVAVSGSSIVGAADP